MHSTNNKIRKYLILFVDIKKYCDKISFIMSDTREFIKKVTLIIIPVMLQQLIVTSVNLVDNLMVGQLGDVNLSGVNAANRFYMVESMVIFGIIGSCMIFLSQFYGSNNFKKVKETFRFALISTFSVSILFFIISFFFSEDVIGYFSNDIRVIEAGGSYLRLASISFLPVSFSFVFSFSMRSIGETKIPLFISVVAVATNTLFNYLLIFGNFNFPTLGIEGAAYATIIARCIELSIYLFVNKRNDLCFKTNLFEIFDIEKILMKKIIIKAMPLVTNEFLWSFGMATLVKFYGTRGVVALTGQTIAQTTSDIFYILFGGMATATTIMVGQKLGANKIDEAKENAYKLFKFSIGLAVMFGILLFASSYVVPNFYNVSDESKYIASNFLRVQGLLLWIYMFSTQCYFIMRAGGDTKSTLIMDSMFMWLFNIPIVFAVTYFTDFNVIIIYAISQSTDLVKTFIAYYFLKKERWLKNLAL